MRILRFFLQCLVASQAMADPFHEPPGADRAGAHLNVPYLSQAGHDVVLDWFRPAHAPRDQRLPVVIFLNSFAERTQRGHRIYRGWAAVANAHDMVAVLPDGATDFAVGFDALLVHLRAHATEMGIDPERIGVYAASSHVMRSLPAVADPRRSAVRAAAFFYGFSDSATFRPDLPVLLMRAGLDRPGMLERQDALLTAALRVNAPVTLINLPAAHHGFESLDADEVSRTAVEQTLTWMKQVLEPSYQASLRARLPLAEAAAAMLRGDPARAAELYGPLVTAAPEDPTLRLAYGEALLDAGRAKEARVQFEQLRNAGLGFRDLGLPAALAAAADGDPESAVAWLRSIPRQFRPASLAQDPGFKSLVDRADFRALFE